MRANLLYFFRVCLRFIRFSDLIENLYDSKQQALFQSRLAGFGNELPVIVPVIGRTVVSTDLMEQLLQVQYFTNLFSSRQ